MCRLHKCSEHTTAVLAASLCCAGMREEECVGGPLWSALAAVSPDVLKRAAQAAAAQKPISITVEGGQARGGFDVLLLLLRPTKSWLIFLR